MNIVNVYISTAQLLLRIEPTSSEYDHQLCELQRLMPKLRQLLSCVVCTKLLSDPYRPRQSRCNHNVCRLCVRGKKKLQPMCLECKDFQDFKTYEENSQTRCLLLCYKSLCEHVVSTQGLFQLLCKQRQPHSNAAHGTGCSSALLPLQQMSLQELICEGASYEDISTAFSLDLPRTVAPSITHLVPKLFIPNKSCIGVTPNKDMSLPPPLASCATTPTTALAPAAALHMLAQSETALKASTLPILSTSSIANNKVETPSSMAIIIKQEPEIPSSPLLTTPTTTVSSTQSTSEYVSSPTASKSLNNSTNSSPATPVAKALLQTAQPRLPQLQQQHRPAIATFLSNSSQGLTIKHLKNFVDLSAAVQLPSSIETKSSTNTTSPISTFTNNKTSNTISSNNSVALAHPATIAYLSPNTPGVVVPIVSSSATTTAPLSIASARLQSLSRQIAQARRTTTAVSSSDAVPPLTFKVSLASSGGGTTVTLQSCKSNNMTTTTTATSTVTSTTTPIVLNANAHQISNAVPIIAAAATTATSNNVRIPPPIKTVSNGSAMYSVLYTGIGNKITIKRKTDNDDDTAIKKANSTSATSSVVSSTVTQQSGLPNTTATSTQTVQAAAPAATTATLFKQVALTGVKTVSSSKRRGCRCGNATPTPGKLTCCGQRCPCYVDSKSCIGCKCRGCRNPHRPDGGKVRPLIPELACYDIQMVDANSSLNSPEDRLPTAITAISESTPTLATKSSLASTIKSTSTSTPIASTTCSVPLQSFTKSITAMPNLTALQSQLQLQLQNQQQHQQQQQHHIQVPHLQTLAEYKAQLQQQLQQQQQKQNLQQTNLSAATTNSSNLMPRISSSNIASTNNNNNNNHNSNSNNISTIPTSATLIPIRNFQTTSNQSTLHTLASLNRSHQQQQQQQQHHHQLQAQQHQILNSAISTQSSLNITGNPSNLLQLENMQRESVLIQNSEGNYQIVNVFTTNSGQQNGSPLTQISGLQSLQTICNVSSTSSISTSPSTSATQQIIMQAPAQRFSQQTVQQQQQQLQRIIGSNPGNNNNNNNTTVVNNATAIPLNKLQQQFKHNNFIAIKSLLAPNAAATSQHLGNGQSTMTATPLISPISASSIASSSSSSFGNTITVSPIIVSSPTALLAATSQPSMATTNNNFTSTADLNMFSSDDSSDGFIALSESVMAAANTAEDILKSPTGSTSCEIIAAEDNGQHRQTIRISKSRIIDEDEEADDGEDDEDENDEDDVLENSNGDEMSNDIDEVNDVNMINEINCSALPTTSLLTTTTASAVIPHNLTSTLVEVIDSNDLQHHAFNTQQLTSTQAQGFLNY